MQRILPVAIVASLIVAGVVLSLTVGNGGESDARDSAALTYPDVWKALEDEPQVEVLISLRPLAFSLDERTSDALAEHADKIQNAVLSALTPADFTLETASRSFLSGLVSRSGAAKLSKHPDVVDIALLTEHYSVPIEVVEFRD